MILPLSLCPRIENGVPSFPFQGKLQGLARARWTVVMENQAVGKGRGNGSSCPQCHLGSCCLILVPDPWTQRHICIWDLCVWPWCGALRSAWAWAVSCLRSVFGVKYLDCLKGWSMLSHPSSFSFFKPKLRLLSWIMNWILCVPYLSNLTHLAQVSRVSPRKIPGWKSRSVSVSCGGMCLGETVACS